MGKAPAHGVSIGTKRPLEAGIEPTDDRRWPGGVAGKARGEHWRDRQRYQSRGHDGERDDHAEFIKEPADHPAHQQNGDEDGDKRNRHGEDGAADFRCALQRGFPHRQPLFVQAQYVFQHDDGIIHHKTY